MPIEVAIMIEGQLGLNWTRWQRLAEAVESLGFIGLYRSDHMTDMVDNNMDALDLWVSLSWLASHTRRIEFGPLVSPVSFRHPVHTARIGAAIDDLSEGRLNLGIGAGWMQREHEMFGFDLLDQPQRFARYEEGLEVVTRLLHSDQPVDFEGRFYRLRQAILLPRPQRPGGPPIVIGGNGMKRTLPLAARYADEWNGVYLTPEEFRRRSARLDELLRTAGRDPASVRRTMMVGCELGWTPEEVERKAAARPEGRKTTSQLRSEGVVIGTADEIKGQLQGLHAAGVQRVMLQWLHLDDLRGLEGLAQVL
jgi:F420-dependent oxidoreductase-like protein